MAKSRPNASTRAARQTQGSRLGLLSAAPLGRKTTNQRGPSARCEVFPCLSSAPTGRQIIAQPVRAGNRFTRAAALRQISISDYVRQVTVAQAGKEILVAEGQTIALTADEQLAFWTALAEPAKLTPAQKKLGRLARGEE